MQIETAYNGPYKCTLSGNGNDDAYSYTPVHACIKKNIDFRFVVR